MTRWADPLVSGLLFVATLTYLSYWPHDLVKSDEGFFLYEAKRLINGAVFYRDFFDIYTPFAWYLMAFLFRLFGTTVETARAAMTVLHAAMVVLVYLACRAVGVRRGLSLAAAMAHPAVFYWAHLGASPHWLSTFLTLLILLVVLRGEPPAGRPALLGLLVGILIGVQHQKGAAMVAAGGIALVVDRLLWDRRTLAGGGLPGQFVRFLGSILAIVVPLCLAVCAAAGWRRVFFALVEFPLRQYRPYHEDVSSWGFYVSWLAESAPGILKYAPAVVKYSIPAAFVVALTRIFLAVKFSADVGQRTLLMLTIWAACTALSIWYAPNYTHIAIAGPVFIVLIIETLDWAVQAIPGSGWVLACLAVAALGRQLHLNLEQQRRFHPFSHATAFGRIDFSDSDEARLVGTLIKRLRREVRSRELFAYPSYAALYLMTGAANPTAYQLLIPGYNSEAQIGEAINVLEVRRVQYVAVLPFAFIDWRTDAMVRYLGRHYEPVDFGTPRGRLSAYMLFKRLP